MRGGSCCRPASVRCLRALSSILFPGGGAEFPAGMVLSAALLLLGVDGVRPLCAVWRCRISAFFSLIAFCRICFCGWGGAGAVSRIGEGDFSGLAGAGSGVLLLTCADISE